MVLSLIVCSFIDCSSTVCSFIVRSLFIDRSFIVRRSTFLRSFIVGWFVHPCSFECIRPQVGCCVKKMRSLLSLPLVSLSLSSFILCHRCQNHPSTLWLLLPLSSSLLKSPSFLDRNASDHRLVVVSKNEVVVVLAIGVFVVVLVHCHPCRRLCGCFFSVVIIVEIPPLPARNASDHRLVVVVVSKN